MTHKAIRPTYSSGSEQAEDEILAWRQNGVLLTKTAPKLQRQSMSGYPNDRFRNFADLALGPRHPPETTGLAQGRLRRLRDPEAWSGVLASRSRRPVYLRQH